jgi:hypothetical protein
MLVTRETGPAPAIVVRRLEHRRWVAAGMPLRGLGIGPLLGGPVERPTEILLAVVKASSNNWPIEVARLRGTRWTVSRPLNEGPGSAQGYIATLDDKAFVIWQQHGPQTGPSYVASAHLAALGNGPQGHAQWTVWSEHNIGPGDLGIAELSRQAWLLTTRAGTSRPTRSLQVHVDPVTLPG